MTEGNRESAFCQGCFDELPVPAGTSPPRLCPACDERALATATAAADALEDRLSEEAWRDGGRLVLPRHAGELPDGCVRCGAEADGGRVRRTLYWHEPLLYLTLLAGPIVYLIVAVATRKQAVVHAPVCRRHLAERRRWLIAGWLTPLFGLGLCILGPVLETAWVAIAGLGILLVGLVPIVIAGRRPVRPVKMDLDFVWLKGAGPAYLDRLPEGPPDFARL